jgi:hypothetical protein
MCQTARRLSRRSMSGSRPGLYLGLIVAYAILQITRSSYRLVSIQEQTALGDPSARHLPPPIVEIAKTNGKKGKLPPLSLLSGPIFYNIFVPPTNLSNTRRIVQEQLIQRKMTSANSTILYTLIGNQDYIDILVVRHDIDSLCQTDCQLRESLNKGDEVHTLQALWEYCGKIPPHPAQDTLVSYIHDKGSFHATTSNEKARRMGTKAALDCRNLMPTNPRQCTICTSAFHVFPQYLGSSK